MYFNSVEEIREIAEKCGTAVFVLPKDREVKIKNALILEPREKSLITIDQVREIIARLSVKQFSEQFIIIRPAELMNDEAANAFLKNLEEPGEKIHFILITDSPSSLLSTIISRAEVYFLREEVNFKQLTNCSESEKKLAKELIGASGEKLISLADQISKKKDGKREHALKILGLAIEMLYKSYFINEKEVFLKKIPKFLKAYEAISRNGHIKLHIVADLC